MATDGPDPPPCDRDVFDHGTCVFVTHTIPSNAMEGWVKNVAKLSGQRVDWHFSGGRACVRALGDLNAVERAIEKLLPEHDELYFAEVKSILGYTNEAPRWWPRKDVG